MIVLLAPLHEVVDEHRPGALRIVVAHPIVDVGGKVQQQVPGVPRYGPLVLLLEELAPDVQELEAPTKNDAPVGDGHFQVDALLPWILGVVKGKVVEVLELSGIVQLLLEDGKLGLQLVDAIDAQVAHPVDELIP